MADAICSVPGCDSPKRARGYCTLHYQRWAKRGDPGPARPEKFRGWPAEVKFRQYVEVTPDHHLWIGGLSSDGYGLFFRDGKSKLSAHRVAYEMEYGPIPEGFEIDHLCSVRNCVRPDHLEAVTHKENVRRGKGWAGTHARSTHCPRGHEYDMVLTSGGRWCSICARETSRLNQRKRRATRRAKNHD